MINIGVLSVQKKNDKPLLLVEKNIGEIKFIIAEISSPNYKVKFAQQLYFKVLNMLAKGLLKNKGAEIIIIMMRQNLILIFACLKSERTTK